MNINLSPITRHNYEAVCDLDVAEHQQDYVACNMFSIVESKFNPGYETRAINHNDIAVGFFMWVKESSTLVSIWRFMVDEKYQQQGIGRHAMKLALKEISQQPGIKHIEICYDPNNPIAQDFYGSFGFKEQGMDEDGEDMLAVINL